MDNVGIVVDDLEEATAFFLELGLEKVGEAPVEGRWLDRVLGLENVRVDIAMLATPDGHSRLELSTYHRPSAIHPEPEHPTPNTLGIRRLMFAVDDLDDALARLSARGAELLGEIEQYGDTYRLCYLRGPAGVIVALAQQLN